MSYEGKGRYRHYKGGEYIVLGTGQPEEKGLDLSNGEHLMVVYAPVDPGVLPFDFWLRPLADFNAEVPDGCSDPSHTEPRFVKIGELA